MSVFEGCFLDVHESAIRICITVTISDATVSPRDLNYDSYGSVSDDTDPTLRGELRK
jgi:hypothetical protein